MGSHLFSTTFPEFLVRLTKWLTIFFAHISMITVIFILFSNLKVNPHSIFLMENQYFQPITLIYTYIHGHTHSNVPNKVRLFATPLRFLILPWFMLFLAPKCLLEILTSRRVLPYKVMPLNKYSWPFKTSVIWGAHPPCSWKSSYNFTVSPPYQWFRIFRFSEHM